MGIPTYTLGYPPDGSSLGQTKSTMRNNLDGTFQTLGIDHVNNNGQPGSNPAGYHNVIHMVTQGETPGTVSGVGQLYSQNTTAVTTDTSLFFKTGGGLIQQLTMNVTPSAATNGYSFLPGGIIMQWGLLNSPGTSGNVNFNIAFPNAVFSVVVTPYSNNNTTTAVVNSNFAPTTSRFTYIIDQHGTVSGLYWFAIGN